MFPPVKGAKFNHPSDSSSGSPALCSALSFLERVAFGEQKPCSHQPHPSRRALSHPRDSEPCPYGTLPPAPRRQGTDSGNRALGSDCHQGTLVQCPTRLPALHTAGREPGFQNPGEQEKNHSSSCVWNPRVFAPWTAAHQAPLSSTVCWSLLRFIMTMGKEPTSLIRKRGVMMLPPGLWLRGFHELTGEGAPTVPGRWPGPLKYGHHPCWPLAPWGPLGTWLSLSHSGGPCPLPPRGLPQWAACRAGQREQLWGFPAPSLGVPRPCFLAVPTRPLPEQRACPSPCATPCGR